MRVSCSSHPRCYVSAVCYVQGVDPVQGTRMHPVLLRFEDEFLSPLETEAKEKLLAVARDQQARSLQW